MARQFKPRTPMYSEGSIHTIELSDLFYRLRSSRADWMGSVRDVSYDWNGNLTLAESLDASELGKWTAPTIERITLPDMVSESDDCTYYNDVTGHSLDVGAFCSGEPECWQVIEPIYKPTARVIRLAIEIGGMGGVPASQLQNRGEAIIAMVNSLELQGHSVEVTIVRAFRDSGHKEYRFLIPIKHAGQAIDVKRLQFIIGHPAFYRRCLFALSELAMGQNINQHPTHTQSYAPNGFVHIPWTSGLGTKRESMEWAKQFALTIAAQN